MRKLSSIVLISFLCLQVFTQKPLPTNQWTCIEIDSSRETYGGPEKFSWLRPFGLDVLDINKDGFKDIISGWYLYINPGNAMNGKWERKVLPLKADGFAFVDVDGDDKLDIIAQELPVVYWLETADRNFSEWKVTKIAEIPMGNDMNSQGYEVADVIPGGKKEILLSTVAGVHMLEIPAKPENGNWPVIKITNSKSDEGIAVGDIDKDGIPDLVCADIPENDTLGAATLLFWYKNPGNGTGNWQRYLVGSTTYPMDRIRVADFNNDGKLEIAVTEERWNVIKPIAGVYFFEVSNKGVKDLWNMHRLGSHYSLNSLDVGDLNNDGFVDIVTTEHKGPNLVTFAYLSNGKSQFKEETLYSGVEMHLGSRLADMDNDGDLDIIGPAWDRFKVFNVLRNDAILKSSKQK